MVDEFSPSTSATLFQSVEFVTRSKVQRCRRRQRIGMYTLTLRFCPQSDSCVQLFQSKVVGWWSSSMLTLVPVCRIFCASGLSINFNVCT